MSRVHELKVVPPYFAAIADGTKTFEVRRNDRAYQTGDVLVLREWHPEQTNSARPCNHAGCHFWQHAFGHWADDGRVIEKRITFIYSGDPRFADIGQQIVVLALGDPS